MSQIIAPYKSEFKYFKVQNPRNSLQIKSYQAELEKCRAEDMKSVMRLVNEVRSDFESLKTEVSNLTENPECLKKKLFSIEEKISHLKEAIKEELSSLRREEVNLFRDVQCVDKRIEDWEKPVDVQTFKPIKKVNFNVRSSNRENPTVEFQKFLSCSGGRYGGWEEQDHLLFLRERTKHKKTEKFFSSVHSLLPDLSYDEIEEHEKWYQKYESLKNSQKEAIQKWRMEKEDREEKNTEKEKPGEKKKVKKAIRHQINIAERIKEWKNQQLLRKMEEEERQKKEKEKLKEEAKRKKEIQEMKKRAVAQYKSEKLGKLEEIFSKERNNTDQDEETKARNKILLKAFRLQDLKFIEKKKIIKLQIESKSNEKFKRLKLAKPALEFILERNPQRIFQPTLIWSQHCLENQKKEKLDPVFDLNSIPRLAIPEWRRELK